MSLEEERLRKEVEGYQIRLQAAMDDSYESGDIEGKSTECEDDREELLKSIEVFNRQLENIGKKKSALENDRDAALTTISNIEAYEKELDKAEKESTALKEELKRHQEEEQRRTQDYMTEMNSQGAELHQEVAAVEAEITHIEGTLLYLYIHTCMHTYIHTRLHNCPYMYTSLQSVLQAVTMTLIDQN